MAGDRPSIKSDPEEAPKPPWHPFPLTELVNLIGIVLAIVGIVWGSGDRQVALVGGGFALIALSSAELALREHLAGYRSHSLLLGGAVGMALVALLLLVVEAPPIVAAAAGAVALGVSAWLFAGAFRRRSGGAMFKVW